MLDLLKYADARLKEPSTYANLAVLLLMMHLTVNPGLMHQLTFIGVIGATVLGVILKEAGNQPPLQIALDVMQALKDGMTTFGPMLAASTTVSTPPATPTPTAPVTTGEPTVMRNVTTALLVTMLSGSLLLAACSGVTPTSTATVAGDVTTLVQDIEADVKGQTLTPAAASTVATQLAKLESDVTGLNAGTTGTTVATVLADVDTAITVIGPFIPEIATLIAAADAKGSAPASPVAIKLHTDYAKLKLDAAK